MKVLLDPISMGCGPFVVTSAPAPPISSVLVRGRVRSISFITALPVNVLVMAADTVIHSLTVLVNIIPNVVGKLVVSTDDAGGKLLVTVAPNGMDTMPEEDIDIESC